MHTLDLLINIAVALVTAFIGGLVARRLGLPAIVGYLLAGMAIGPFTPGFIGDVETITQLAELGVIFLMFGVGLHFSLRDLWAVRSVAIPGATLQILTSTALGLALTQFWGWSLSAGLVLGFSISIASTVVLLRGLTDNGWLHTLAGQVAVGWLVLEDLATIVILVLLPAIFGGGEAASAEAIIWALLKAAIFVALMLVVGVRFLPWLLTRIAFTGTRELFILAVVAIAVGTALGSAELFGVSLALGGFLAGVVLGESAISHQIGADVVPFRDVFTVVFFVSVGMLVNPAYLFANLWHVLALTVLIVIGKPLLTIVFGLFLPASAHTMLVAAAGLGQIGEFSFIVGTAGVALGVITQDQYSLILAGSLISIVINPFLFRLVVPVEKVLQRFPALWERLDRHGPSPQLDAPTLKDHVVIVGAGRVGEHILAVLERLEVPLLVVENDPKRAVAFENRGVPTLFGDAANSEVLNHAGLERARVLVVTLPDEAATEMVVSAARRIEQNLPVVARAATRSGVQRLHELGAEDVIHPELEGGLEVVRHTLLALGFSADQVQPYTDAVRRDQYDIDRFTPGETQALDQMRNTVRGLDIVWRRLDEKSPIVGQTLAQADLRSRTGASVIAIIKSEQGRSWVVPNPKSSTPFERNDLVGLIGDPAQIAALDALLASPAGRLPDLEQTRDDGLEPTYGKH
ncbi:MAG TPA: cation:proton antiporter [Chloroflexia bacterium]|nr:cation:proton antiporter [Chloroflexia bacterium]